MHDSQVWRQGLVNYAMAIQTDQFADRGDRLISAGKESSQEEVLERALRPRKLGGRKSSITVVKSPSAFTR